MTDHDDAIVSRVLREVAQCWARKSNVYAALSFDTLLCARADELAAQNMPGTLDIPGVKDYVNATPPEGKLPHRQDGAQRPEGVAPPAAGLCQNCDGTGFLNGLHCRCRACDGTGKSAPSPDAALDEAMEIPTCQHDMLAGNDTMRIDYDSEHNYVKIKCTVCANSFNTHLERTDPSPGAALERYGLQWNGPRNFVCTLMPDGYWTPWWVADEYIRQQAGRIAELEKYANFAADALAVVERRRDELKAERDALRAENERLKELAKGDYYDAWDACWTALTPFHTSRSSGIEQAVAEIHSLKAWRTWGKDVALPAMVSGDWKRVDAAIVSAPKDAP